MKTLVKIRQKISQLPYLKISNQHCRNREREREREREDPPSLITSKQKQIAKRLQFSQKSTKPRKTLLWNLR